MIVARTIQDRHFADELRAACTLVALDVGGWSRKKSKVKPSPSDGAMLNARRAAPR
jgi:hypothetical protein